MGAPIKKKRLKSSPVAICQDGRKVSPIAAKLDKVCE